LATNCGLSVAETADRKGARSLTLDGRQLSDLLAASGQSKELLHTISDRQRLQTKKIARGLLSKLSLAALAVLKVNWDRDHRDYLESFVPLVADSVRTLANDAISLPDLQREVGARFGIDIPQQVLRTLLSRLAKYHYVNARDGIFYRDVAHCNSLDFGSRQRELEATYDRIIQKLVTFARSRYELEWTSDFAESVFVKFLRSDDERVLYARYERASVALENSSTVTDRFVVAAFVEQTQASDAKTFEDIASVAKGHMLAAALFVSEPSRIEQKFKDTQVFFDTPLLLAYLGYAGPEREFPATEVVDLLKEARGDLACFRATVTELQGVLEASARNLDGSKVAHGVGDVVEYFVGRGMTESDVLLAASRIPAKLEVRGFKIVDFPDCDPMHQQFDEALLQEDIRKNVGYRDDRPMIHDAQCASAICQLRRGRVATEIERSHAVFVTTNIPLVQRVLAFTRKADQGATIPLFVTDSMLGTLLWLKNPTRAPDLPVKRLIADAYASLQPSEDLWKRYLAELAKLRAARNVEEGDYLLLRHSVSAKRALMDLTHGDEQAFTEGTVADVLAVAKETVRADLVAQLAAQEVEREREKREAASEANELKLKLKQRDGVVDSLEARVASDARRTQRRNRQWAGTSWQASGVVLALPRWAVVVISSYASFRPWFANDGASATPWTIAAQSAASLGLAVLSLWSLLTGGYVRRRFDQWQKSIAGWLLANWWDLRPLEVEEALAAHLESTRYPD
jgi:hypothetical protein